MAYDRYDPREMPRDQRSRWSEDRHPDRPRSISDDWRGGRPDDRGFFDRASDEVASWFGDDEAERRRHEDRLRDEREGRNWRPGSSADDADRGRRREFWGGGDQDRFRERGRDYRPLTGDYARGRFDEPSAREDYRRTSWTGSSDWSDRSRQDDPHYRSWRDRQLSELDRDYDDYRRERQAKFESDFGSWRERRQAKRSLLGQIREHMDVVGNDDQHIGTVDKIAGDRIILTRSDPQSGGVHHSLSCSDVDRIEGDRVVLDCSASQARDRWRDEDRSRALFERDDQGEMGPRMLDRSFEGTYR